MADLLAPLRAALSDRYRIERELGQGGMATVYLAHDLRHDRDVAIKVLKAEVAQTVGAERFLREIHIAAKLAHPHILPLFDSGDAGGVLYYVMPNVEGHSLRDRLERDRLLPVDEAVHIAKEVAGALDYAHRHEVVHRDIKPENIMLQDGHALVADFGIGKALSGPAGETATQVGVSVGTPAYMSPEQAAGERVDGRSDLYSLACVLYEMLTGEQPFTGPTVQAVIAKRFVQTPADVTALREGISRPVARALQKALARTPIDRYDTAALFVTSLSEIEVATPKAAAPEKSIAVLPFVNLSADPENEFFADGITEEILNALAQVRDLRVAGHTSSFSFKGKPQDLRLIGEQLTVRTVLEGSVRRSGKRVRITAQLVDVTDGYHLWSEKYDREIEDVFAVQDEIAAAIAERLKTTLSGGAAARAQRTTDNIEAYEAYLKGRALFYRRGVSIKEGMVLMRRALELDPEYALAWAGLADGYSLSGFYATMPPEGCSAAAREAAAKALALGPDLAEAHLANAQVSLLFDWDWARAEQFSKRALEINPGYMQASVWYGVFYLGFVSDRWREAVDLLLAAQRAEPLSAYAAAVLGYAMANNGQPEEAVRWVTLACQLDPAAYLSHWVRQMALHMSGQHTAAIEAADKALSVSGRMQGALVILALSCVATDDLASARAVYREMEARSVREYISPCLRAQVAAAIGEREAAVALAREAYARRDPVIVVFGRSKPTWALRELPEFQEILTAMNMPGWKGSLQ